MSLTPSLRHTLDKWALEDSRKSSQDGSAGHHPAYVHMIQGRVTRCVQGNCTTTIIPPKVIQIEPMNEWGPQDVGAKRSIERILGKILQKRSTKAVRRRKSAIGIPFRRSSSKPSSLRTRSLRKSSLRKSSSKPIGTSSLRTSSLGTSSFRTRSLGTSSLGTSSLRKSSSKPLRPPSFSRFPSVRKSLSKRRKSAN